MLPAPRSVLLAPGSILPLRIAMFVGCYPVVSETFIMRQITGLIDLGHEVDIYADTRPGANTPVHPEVAKYRLIERTTYMDMPPETAPWEMPVWPITGRTWPPGATMSVHNCARVARALPKFFRCLLSVPRLTLQVLKRSEYRYQASSLSVLYRLYRLLSQPKRYDVLHAHFGPLGNSFRFAKKLFHAPLVVSFHGYDFSTLPRKEGIGMYQKLFETADLVTVNSEYTRGRVARLGCPSKMIHKLPVGLNPEQFPFRERVPAAGEPLRILSVGRLVEIKGHEYAICAIERFRRQYLNVRFDIVGDGPLRSTLEKLIAELHLSDAVTLHGSLDTSEVKQLMAKAHIFVLASVSVEGDQEGQGLVLQEAQASGLPVIATNHGALPEGMIDGKSGFLVPERDVDTLIERLKYLAEHPEVWSEMGREGRKYVEAHFDARTLNRQVVELYLRATENYHGSSE